MKFLPGLIGSAGHLAALFAFADWQANGGFWRPLVLGAALGVAIAGTRFGLREGS